MQIVQNATKHSMFLFGTPADPSTNGYYNKAFEKLGDTYHLAEINGRDFELDFLRPKGVPDSPFAGIVEGTPINGGG